MDDYIYQINRYLPIKFVDDEANEFLKYLEETYLENIKNKKYQFAFKAFHMLYMTCIYKFSWFIMTINKEVPEEKTHRIKTRDDGNVQIQQEIVPIKKLFEYSSISENEIIQKLLHKKGFHVNDFDKCANHINVRNHCSHASGKIEYDERGISFIISDELSYVEKLQNEIKTEQKKFLESFLEEKWSESLIKGDIDIFFTNNNISIKDLELITSLDLPLFKKKSNNQKIVFQKILYLVLISEAQKYIESDNNLFLEKLPMFIVGLEKEIEINKDGQNKKVSIGEIVEEHLVPIISQFDTENREKAETILSI